MVRSVTVARARGRERGGREGISHWVPNGVRRSNGMGPSPLFYSRLLIERGMGERDAMRSPGALLLRYERPRRRAGVKGDKAR